MRGRQEGKGLAPALVLGINADAMGVGVGRDQPTAEVIDLSRMVADYAVDTRCDAIGKGFQRSRYRRFGE